MARCFLFCFLNHSTALFSAHYWHPPWSGTTRIILGGSWHLVSKVISTLIGVISIVTLFITSLTKSHDPPSTSLNAEPGRHRTP